MTDSGDNTRFEDRQQALLDLLQAETKPDLDDERILRMAEKAKLLVIFEKLIALKIIKTLNHYFKFFYLL